MAYKLGGLDFGNGKRAKRLEKKAKRQMDKAQRVYHEGEEKFHQAASVPERDAYNLGVIGERKQVRSQRIAKRARKTMKRSRR